MSPASACGNRPRDRCQLHLFRGEFLQQQSFGLQFLQVFLQRDQSVIGRHLEILVIGALDEVACRYFCISK